MQNKSSVREQAWPKNMAAARVTARCSDGIEGIVNEDRRSADSWRSLYEDPRLNAISVVAIREAVGWAKAHP
jgi:hypothetical protein